MLVYVCVLMTDNDTGSPWEDVIKVVADEMKAIEWECEKPLDYDSNQITWHEYRPYEVE